MPFDAAQHHALLRLPRPVPVPAGDARRVLRAGFAERVLHDSEMAPQYADRWNKRPPPADSACGPFPFSIVLVKAGHVAGASLPIADVGFDAVRALNTAAWRAALAYTTPLRSEWSGGIETTPRAAHRVSISCRRLRLDVPIDRHRQLQAPHPRQAAAVPAGVILGPATGMTARRGSDRGEPARPDTAGWPLPRRIARALPGLDRGSARATPSPCRRPGARPVSPNLRTPPGL